MSDKKEDLQKVHPTPTLPKLGMPDDRRETPIIPAKQVPTKNRLIGNQYMAGDTQTPAHLRADTVKEIGNQLGQDKVHGMTGRAGVGSTVSYAVQSKNPKSMQPIRTKLHEDTHLMFNRVTSKFGKGAASKLAVNLFNAIPKEHQAHMQLFVKSKYPKGGLDSRDWHEEHLAHLVSYLNDPEVRTSFHKQRAGDTSPVTGQLTEQGQQFHSKMKQAYRFLQQASRKATPHWTKRILHPTQSTALHKSMDWVPSKADEDAAADMLYTFHDGLPEFEAAKFMSKQYTPSQEEKESALQEYECDYESAALKAHGIEVNDANIRTLRRIMDMKNLNKAENDFDVAIMPRIVEPFNNEAMFVADLVRDAFVSNEVRSVKLSGKHSEGTALVKNPDDGVLWLLKPGSGKISPAQGAAEEPASQSRREVAFNQIASVIGLGRYVPRSALLILDGKEVACLEFFSEGYEPLERARKNKDRQLDKVFEKFVSNGLLYKWAAMDYLLGQPDRHAGNIMIDDGDNIRFIDAGSAFCGPSFSPAVDPKSFVPFYLRVFTPRKFIALTPQERFNVMPSLTANTDLALKAWVDSINDGQIVGILNQFNINPQWFVNRLNALRNYPRAKSEFLRKFYSNLSI